MTYALRAAAPRASSAESSYIPCERPSSSNCLFTKSGSPVREAMASLFCALGPACLVLLEDPCGQGLASAEASATHIAGMVGMDATLVDIQLVGQYLTAARVVEDARLPGQWQMTQLPFWMSSRVASMPTTAASANVVASRQSRAAQDSRSACMKG